MKKQGFTLIEMMIVVAVIGVLAAVAVLKYAEMSRKAREGNIKANLGQLRSALVLYYSDNSEGYPLAAAGENQTSLHDALIPKYLVEIPTVKIIPHHGDVNTVDNVASRDFVAEDASDNGGWVYVSEPSSSDWGYVAVECYHEDSKGIPWTGH